MAARENRYDWVAGDVVRVRAGEPTGVDGPVPSHVPGPLPVEAAAVPQDWDGLRPALRERLSAALGVIVMWWRDDIDPFRTTVSAFGERGMCLAFPETRGTRAGHRLETRVWAPESLTSREFRGPARAPDAPTRGRAGRNEGARLSLPADVSALLGHLPTEAQRYLQIPLLTGGGAADGRRWYQTWDDIEHTMDVWLWLRAGRAVTFAQGRRAAAHWELRCWRAAYA